MEDGEAVALDRFLATAAAEEGERKRQDSNKEDEEHDAGGTVGGISSDRRRDLEGTSEHMNSLGALRSAWGL